MFSDQSSLLPFLKQRYIRLQELMQQRSIDALLVSTGVHLYYLSGRIFDGFILLPSTGNPLFFVRRPSDLNGSDVQLIRKIEDIPVFLNKQQIAMPQTLALENDRLSQSQYLRITNCFSSNIIVNGSPLLSAVRSVKDAFEIDLIAHSGKQHAKAYGCIASVFRAGMRDIDLSIEVERLMRQHGSLGIFRIAGQTMEIYGGSILVGENAQATSPYDFALGGRGLDASLPIGADGTVIEPGMAVMVDMGGNFTGYMSDMTRVFCDGQLSEKAVRAHRLSIDIHAAVQQMARPGVEAAAIYRLAMEMVSAAALQDCFMGTTQKAAFVGHGVGIEINEAPILCDRSKEVLQEGNVFALEPKFTIDGVGAVGIENTYVVTATGLRNLTVFAEDIQSLSIDR